MDWRPVQDVPCFSPNESWDRLQAPRDPELDQASIENQWMDGSINFYSTKFYSMAPFVCALVRCGMSEGFYFVVILIPTPMVEFLRLFVDSLEDLALLKFG